MPSQPYAKFQNILKSLLLVFFFCQPLAATAEEIVTLDPLYYDAFFRKNISRKYTLTVDEASRIATWKESKHRRDNPIQLTVQFDESLEAQSETLTSMRRIPSSQREVDAFRAALKTLSQTYTQNIENIFQYHGCDLDNYKELNSEGKRAKFGKKRLKGNNHQTHIVCYPKDNDPMKSLLSTTEIKKFERQDSIQLFFRWETVSGMEMAEKTYTPKKKPLLPTKEGPFVALSLTFQGVSTIKDYVTWKRNPSYFKDAVFCEHGIVVGFMGEPVETLKDFRKIYQKKYQLDSLDSLTVPIEIVRNTAPFKREQMSLDVDPKKRTLIVERRRVKAEMIEKKRLVKLAEERRLEQLRIAKLAEEKRQEDARLAALQKRQLEEKEAKRKRAIAARTAKLNQILNVYHTDKKHGAFRALVMLKYLNDHQPHFLTKEQRVILAKLGYAKQDILGLSIPVTERSEIKFMMSFGAKSPIARTRENSDYYMVKIVKGELAMFTRTKGKVLVTPVDDPVGLVHRLMIRGGSPRPLSTVDSYRLCKYGSLEIEERDLQKCCELSRATLKEYERIVAVIDRPTKKYIPQKIAERNKRNLRDAAITIVALGVMLSGDNGGVMNDGRFIHLENNGALGQGQFIGKPTSKKDLSGMIREIRHKYQASDGTVYTFVQDLKTEKWRLSGFDDAAFSTIVKSYKTKDDLLNAVEGEISRRIGTTK